MAKKKILKKSNWFQIITTKGSKYAGNIAKFLGKTMQEGFPSDAVEVTDAEGKSKGFFELYEEVTGHLNQVMIYDRELNQDTKFEELSVSVDNGEGENENIKVTFKSRYAACFISRLENVDLTRPVTLKSFCILDKEKSKEKGKEIYNQLFLIYQNGKSIENRYKKDSGFSLPEFKEVKKKKAGKMVSKWDTSDYEEALREIVLKVNAEIKSLRAEAGSHEDLTGENNTPDNDSPIDNGLPIHELKYDYNDDLPF